MIERSTGSGYGDVILSIDTSEVALEMRENLNKSVQTLTKEDEKQRLKTYEKISTSLIKILFSFEILKQSSGYATLSS